MSQSKQLPAETAVPLRPIVGQAWHDWTKPEDVPSNKWLIVELGDSHFKFQTAIFRKDANGRPFGAIGGRFHFDCKIIRWMDASHMLPNTR